MEAQRAARRAALRAAQRAEVTQLLRPRLRLLPLLDDACAHVAELAAALRGAVAGSRQFAGRAPVAGESLV